MDISKIDFNYMEIFALSYTVSSNVFEVEPISATPKMQKKIRKWIEKTNISGESYPKKVMKFIDKEVSDEDFIKFIKACHDEIQLNGTLKKRLFDKFSVDLSEEVKSAVWSLLGQFAFCGNIRKNGADAQIDVEFGSGYDRTLTLLNASCIPEGDYDCLSFENGYLLKKDDGYCLTGQAENFEKDLTIPFAIRFTDATVDVVLSRANEGLFSLTPWHHLQVVASTILDKFFLPGEYLNDKERELVPLIAEIGKLSYWAHIPDEFNSADFSKLKSYILEFGHSELLPLFEGLEKEYSNNKKKIRIIGKLNSKLNNQKYESLWRRLYNTLSESQDSYPSRVSMCCSAELLKETRTKIQKLLESHGYTGEYPNFVKKGAIRNIRLAESYDMSYFVGAEKNVVYHIHCNEDYFNEHLTIEFLCGTELLHKNESAGDIYSCLFNANGRRLFQTVQCECSCDNSDGEKETDSLEKRVQIAVKRAELIKLTKEEQKEISGFDYPYWKLFLFVFIIMGGLFSVLLNFGFMLIEVVTCLILNEPQAIPSVFTEIPWWAFILLAWVLFGGAMGIITVLSKKK